MTKDEVWDIGVRLGKSSRGAVGAWELRREKVDGTVLARLVDSGRVHRLWRGMFVFGLLTDGAKACAAVKHAKQRLKKAAEQPEPVITGLVAVRALEVEMAPTPTLVQVLVGEDVHRASYPGVVELRRTQDLDDLCFWSDGKVRMAMVDRAVYDGARECGSLQDTRGLVLGAVAKGATPEALKCLVRKGSHTDTTWLARAIVDAERGCASPPEAEACDAMIGCGRPFYMNPDLFIGDDFLCRPDIFVVGTGSGGELNGRKWHFEDDEKANATMNRHVSASRHIELLHRTPTKARKDWPGFVRDLLAQADDRLARGLGDPPGLVIRPRGPLLF